MAQARQEGTHVERMLMEQLGVKPAQLGRTLSHFFGVPYLPFDAKRIRSEALHGKLKPDFVGQCQWLPLEEGPDGLVIMAVDPEDARSSKLVPQVFPQFARLVFAVTTADEFAQTASQLVGAGSEAGGPPDMLSDLPLAAD